MTVVVLNQADRLRRRRWRQVRSDLARLAADDGIARRPGDRHLGHAPVPGSTTCGCGWPLRWPARTPPSTGWPPTSRPVAGTLRAGVADAEPDLADTVDAELVDALARAAGIPTVVAAVERDYRHEAWGAPAGRSPGGCAPCGPTR